MMFPANARKSLLEIYGEAAAPAWPFVGSNDGGHDCASSPGAPLDWLCHSTAEDLLDGSQQDQQDVGKLLAEVRAR
jgi:hypothetical protein